MNATNEQGQPERGNRKSRVGGEEYDKAWLERARQTMW